jgi:hypothetical protein
VSTLDETRTLAKTLGLRVTTGDDYESVRKYTVRDVRDDDAEIFCAENEDVVHAFLLGWIACQGRR